MSDRPAHRPGDPAGKQADEKLDRSGRKNRRQLLVANVVMTAGARGMTGSEVADEMDLPHNYVSGRLSELRRQRVVIKTAELRLPSSSGRARGRVAMQAVWIHRDRHQDRLDIWGCHCCGAPSPEGPCPIYRQNIHRSAATHCVVCGHGEDCHPIL